MELRLPNMCTIVLDCFFPYFWFLPRLLSDEQGKRRYNLWISIALMQTLRDQIVRRGGHVPGELTCFHVDTTVLFHITHFTSLTCFLTHPKKSAFRRFKFPIWCGLACSLFQVVHGFSLLASDWLFCDIDEFWPSDGTPLWLVGSSYKILEYLSAKNTYGFQSIR